MTLINLQVARTEQIFDNMTRVLTSWRRCLFLFRRARTMNSDAHSMVMSNEIIMRSHTAPTPPLPPPPLTKENNFPAKCAEAAGCVSETELFISAWVSFMCPFLAVESVPRRIFHHAQINIFEKAPCA